MRKIIDKLEYLYEGLDKQKAIAIYVGVAIVFAAFFVTTLSLPGIEKEQQLQNELNELNKKIDAIKLEQFKNKKVSLGQQKLQQVAKYNEKRKEFMSNLSIFNSHAFIKFSNENMAEFLNLVMKDSLKNSLIIKSVENKTIEDEKLYKYSITITGNGKYLDVVRYVQNLVSFDALLSLQEFEIFINEQNNLEFILLFYFGGE